MFDEQTLGGIQFQSPLFEEVVEWLEDSHFGLSELDSLAGRLVGRLIDSLCNGLVFFY